MNFKSDGYCIIVRFEQGRNWVNYAMTPVIIEKVRRLNEVFFFLQIRQIKDKLSLSFSRNKLSRAQLLHRMLTTSEFCKPVFSKYVIFCSFFAFVCLSSGTLRSYGGVYVLPLKYCRKNILYGFLTFNSG